MLMIARVVRSGSLAAALLVGTATLVLADNDYPAATTPAFGMQGTGEWACSSPSTVSSAASSGPAAGTGVPNDQTGLETDSGVSAVGRSTPAFGPQQLHTLLSQQGYTNVSDIRCSNGAWVFHGGRGGSEEALRVNPQTGAIESQ
jgi:hypothetical protein